MRSHMKIAALLSVAAAVGLKSGALAAPYDELAAKGYRWITTDGPYVCPSKDDLRQIIKHRADEAVIERLRAYYLIEGAIVQVVQEDAATGVSKIHSAEIGPLAKELAHLGALSARKHAWSEDLSGYLVSLAKGRS
jgi:hypothetical protein